MDNNNFCSYYSDPDYIEYLVEYRGDLLSELSNIDYACGYIINDKFAIVSVKSSQEIDLLKAVPSILVYTQRPMIVLNTIESTATNTSNIQSIKGNPYLFLNGRGVLVGMVDTGIDYLNNEFIRADGTTRIETLWDQTIPGQSNVKSIFIGETYSSNNINNAIIASKEGKDPYEIVPSKDTIGHGTQLAGIIGATGNNKELKGIADDCTFIIVKIAESSTFKKDLQSNNINNVPVYNVAELVAGIEYIKNYALKANKPLVLLIGMGASTYSHDGLDLFSRYLYDITSTKGIVVVAGTGNEGIADGHASGVILSSTETKTTELSITRELKTFTFFIFIRRPNKMSINIVSPSGEESSIISSKIKQEKIYNFIYENTTMYVRMLVPDNFTGIETIRIDFKDIKPGIWKFQLKGDYIVNGRFDMWLPPSITLNGAAKFLNPDPYITLTAPSASRKVVSVAYYNQQDDSIVNESGKGFPFATFIKPEIAAPGINILTTGLNNKSAVVSGSSVAAAITAGVCALILQWGIIDGNDSTLFSTKIISYLTTGASRRMYDTYPNADWGYGKLDLEGTFNILSGKRVLSDNRYREFNIGNLFVRIPIELEVSNNE